MRLGLQSLALLALTASLAACGSSEKKATESTTASKAAVWPGPPKPAVNGKLAVGEFNTYLGDRQGPASPTQLALEFIRADETQVARTTTEAQASPEGGGPTTVTVVQDGLADDSVKAARHVLRFEPDGGNWRLESAVRIQQCQAGRGHQDFTAGDCV